MPRSKQTRLEWMRAEFEEARRRRLVQARVPAEQTVSGAPAPPAEPHHHPPDNEHAPRRGDRVIAWRT